MTLSGLSDSLASVIADAPSCPRCDSASHIAGGLCVGCLLQSGLDPGEECEADALVSALAEINLPDQNWRLGNYEILEEIGRGGMGVIYRARQRHSRRIVAVKRVLSYHSDSRETLARFRREAQAAASLDHPNILPIYEVSESEDGLPFFSMKFAPGGNLQEVAPALRNDPRQCVALVAKVARAVQYAHAKGILHRDLKPGNILLDARGEPLVSDFGLAKWLDTTSELTRTLTIFGTPGYIAPEQASGPAADLKPAADIYSLGAILFDLLAGRPPFLGAHALSVIRQAAESPAPKLRTLSKIADRDLEIICAHCLEREPKLRYPSAHDLAEDLERWLEGRPIIARPVSPPTKLWRWSRRNPLIASAVALMILTAGAVSFREIERRELEKGAHNERMALRSVAVLPLINLDTITAETGVAAKLASIFRTSMTKTAPARIEMVTDSTLTGIVATPSRLREINRKHHVRTVLAGTVRRVGNRLRVSLTLFDSARGATLLQRVVEIESADARPLADRLRSVSEDLDRILAHDNLVSVAQPEEDPGLRSTVAREFIVAGKELSDRRSGQDLDRAVRCFEKAVATESSSSVAHAHLALARLGLISVLFDADLLKKAEAAANEAIRFGPNRSETHRAMAMVLEKKGDFERAQEEIYRAIDAEGLQERLASHLGAISVMMGRPDRALHWSQIASQWQTRPATYEHLMGDCLVELGLDEQAEAAYQRVTDLQPEMPEGWMGICHLRLLQGDLRTARDLWLANGRRYDNFELARQMGAQVEFFTQNYPEAIKMYETLANSAPDGGDHFYGAVSYKSALGALLLLTGRADEGRALLRSRLATLQPQLETAPRNSAILYEMAAIESSLGSKNAALKHFRDAAASGWTDYRSALIDPRFNNIKTEQQFRDAIDVIGQRVASLQQGVSSNWSNSEQPKEHH
jgi:serine/threonine protein kinase/tetratricopeptide (TPR) repeat protein